MANDLKEAAGYVIASLLGAATLMPKLLNYFKGEGINGSILDRVKAMEDHARLQDRRAVQQDDKIHKLAVKTTRLMMVVIRLEGLLVEHKVDLPQDLIDEIIELKNSDVDDAWEESKK